jgi:hypothetical protein
MTANAPKTPMPKPTPLQTLEDAIAMALSNGWTKGDLGLIFTLYSLPELLRHNRYYMIIFDHKFAQALWGKKRIEGAMLASPNEASYIKNPSAAIRHYKLNESYGWHQAWELHLQRMVAAADPLKYLEENLPA